MRVASVIRCARSTVAMESSCTACSRAIAVATSSMPARRDAVVVLQGSKTRLPLGYRLVQEGYAPLLLVSRGSRLGLEHSLCDGETTLKVICFSATSTRGEA